MAHQRIALLCAHSERLQVVADYMKPLKDPLFSTGENVIYSEHQTIYLVTEKTSAERLRGLLFNSMLIHSSQILTGDQYAEVRSRMVSR